MTIATALKHMLAAGMPHDAIVAAVAEMEAQHLPAAPVRLDGDGNGTAWVYVIEVDHPGASPLTKVGISQHPERRRVQLEKQRGFNLHLARSFGPFLRRQALEIEKAAHFRLHARQESGEWFWCSSEDAIAVVQECQPEELSR